MGKFYEDKDFLKLQEKWYKKLKTKNFDDIEIYKKTVPNGHYIKRDQKSYARKYNATTEEYYRRCRIHLEHHKFASVRLKWIFTWHADGKSYREIVKLFNRRFRAKRSIFFIFSKTKQLLLEMQECSYWLDTDIEPQTMLGVGRIPRNLHSGD